MINHCLLVLALSLQGANMWTSHGHNYSYFSTNHPGSEVTYFPVVWDMRTANSLLLDWHRLYSPGQLNPVFEIIEDAAASGINTVIVRSELGDRWFPEMPGTFGDKFFPLAGAIRETGMNLMPGGIKTALYSDAENQAAVDYLSLYIEMTAGDYPGDVSGMFGFDEPDVKYLEYQSQQQEWLDNYIYWSQVCRDELGLSVLSYMSKYGTADAAGYMEYYSDTTCVLNRLARYSDMVGMGMYPAKNNFRRTDLLHSSLSEPLFVCASDLVQNDPMQAEAMNCQDEILSVIQRGDAAEAVIEEVIWDGEDLHLQTSWTFPLGFLPDGFASSDFRSGYAVHEASGYVNSGVVLWDSSEPVNRAVLIAPVNGSPMIARFPGFQGSENYFPVFASVGQTDYWADILDVQGIIGRGRFCVLFGLEDQQGEKWLMLFIASEPGSYPALEPAFQEPRRLYFPATDAVWGTFWGTWFEFGTIQPVARNGFIIYDELGNYVSLNQLSRNYWQVFPAYGVSQYPDLFGEEGLPDHIRVSRDDGNYPPFFAGRDVLVGLFSERSELVTAFSLYNGGYMTELDTIGIQGLSAPVTGFGLLRDDYRYSDKPVFTGVSGEVRIGSSLADGMSSGTMETETVSYCTGDTIIAGIRPMYTRDAIRSLLIGCEEGYYMPNCELYDDKLDDWRFQWYPNAHRTGMELGVQATERDNVLFAVIQSYGRRGFALPTYCPSPDTLLYMVTTPVVEGARGLVFYAMDIAMMSGNGGDDGIERAPFVLQNWGPSRDRENTDMIGRVHETVARLTGNGIHEVDYLSPLADSTWTVLHENEACNADPSDSLLNFIAIQNPAADTVLVLAVNTATSASPFQTGIVFSKLPVGFSIVDSEGFQPDMFTIEIHPDGGTVTELDYSSIPPLTASLVALARDNGGQCQGNYLQTATDSQGSTAISFSLCDQTTGELALYDLAGRRVSTIWEGAGTGFRINALIRKTDYPAGVYFAVLSSENLMLSGKCILW